MGIMKNELQLIEGKKNIRDKYISKVEVLDRVKELSLLPYNETATTEMIAEYYGVEIKTIQKVIERNKGEFIEDGMVLAKGNQLADIKSVCNMRSKARQLTIFPRRAILRVGMLLRDSEVAKQIRNYLLNVEEVTTQGQKSVARRSSWTSQEELTVLNSVIMSVNNGGTLNEGLIKASKSIGKKYSAVNSRWHYKIKNFADKEILEKIKGNVGKHMKVDSQNNVGNVSDSNIELELGYQIDKVYRENGKLTKENVLLKEENERLKRSYKKLKSEHTKVMNIIGSAMKSHTSEVLKMDSGRLR